MDTYESDNTNMCKEYLNVLNSSDNDLIKDQISELHMIKMHINNGEFVKSCIDEKVVEFYIKKFYRKVSENSISELHGNNKKPDRDFFLKLSPDVKKLFNLNNIGDEFIFIFLGEIDKEKTLKEEGERIIFKKLNAYDNIRINSDFTKSGNATDAKTYLDVNLYIKLTDKEIEIESKKPQENMTKPKINYDSSDNPELKIESKKPSSYYNNYNFDDNNNNSFINKVVTIGFPDKTARVWNGNGGKRKSRRYAKRKLIKNSTKKRKKKKITFKKHKRLSYNK